MPLHDHFSPPLNRRRHWGAFHAAWAAEIAKQLNRGVLPEAYIAEPLISWGGQVEIDVATQTEAAREEGSIALATYAPPAAKLSVPVDWTVQDVVEIQVTHEEGGLRLVAAIELVSPANKDRPSHRDAFVSKCLGYLRAGVGVAIVDIVTSRSGQLVEQLISALGSKLDTLASPLYAAAFRTIKGNVEAWPEPLEIGKPLPTLPLWLAEDLAAPLDLEESYLAACDNLRIE